MRGLRAAGVILLATAAAVTFLLGPATGAAGYRLVGWNDLGMHCMDSDFSLFSLLPPYNNVVAQLIDPTGKLVSDAAGVSVTYEGASDPRGSRNSTSVGKTNFWVHAHALFGATLAPDVGLAGNAMPGAANAPQAMTFDPARRAFVAQGIPITPRDDSGAKNPYPVMRLVARGDAGAELASTNVVLPVSDEMDCRECHGSGTAAQAMPAGGWANDPDPDRDYRRNVLAIHDDLQRGEPLFQQALAWAGYAPEGLTSTAIEGGTAILCAKCHGSNALGTSGYAGVPPLTSAIHDLHADVRDPATGETLDAATNRTACYSCHPGSATRCLRGVMGASVAADGTMAIQCQSCHGNMTAVGDLDRQGWLDEPSCQSCHTGTAVNNAGQIRFTSAFDGTGKPRQAVDAIFATNPDTPSAGLSLYKLSRGHGGLECEACHGATHAEYPTLHDSDNLQSQAIQGHVGTLVECTSCHASAPRTTTGGPHGLHPVGQVWVERHPDAAEDQTQPCRSCHGADYRGTVLSRAQADRTVDAFGATTFWRGFEIGCYTCHQGPDESDRNPNRPPVVQDASLETDDRTPVSVALTASDPDGDPITLRIVSQPAHGTVALNAGRATFYPEAGFDGTARFRFAARDGSTDSNLGTVTVTVHGLATPTTTTTRTPPPSATPGPSGSPTPTATGNASATHVPSGTTPPTVTAGPSATLDPFGTPAPTATAGPSATHAPSGTPPPTATAGPSTTPGAAPLRVYLPLVIDRETR